jgi:hypothetical protein
MLIDNYQDISNKPARKTIFIRSEAVELVGTVLEFDSSLSGSAGLADLFHALKVLRYHLWFRLDCSSCSSI